ncbi:hypothetical protein CEUSTIGMA_g9647.t1 [Chlamydomonas eustigma]|uniref:Kinesin-like protein n=1 Tax=Chlamydomonas eustigma TaxID=1157962 RepID=A0A250XH26_9CHLO|nr:hypothetical protein CEUSTIGMA_g9647.t1 [Chlamydomonas eustigma]|eukprot:GAX82219.1 hypothetical protein CEUSTIGMA_g9647.t1 [Chlamydomonas eustigma]
MTSVSLKEWVSPNKSIDQTEGNGMAAMHLPVFGAIKVAVRVRPLTPQESLNHVHTSVEVDEDNSYVIAAESRQNQPRKFTFDEVLGPTCSQALVFSKCVAHSVDAFFDGYNSTVMAYGQTGSGKTHTMSQIVPEVVRNLFQAIDARKEDGTQCHLVIQYVELYNEELRDLLLVAKVPAQANQASPPSSGGRGDHPLLGSSTSYRTASNINIRETAEGEIFLEGCREIPVNNAFELMSWIAAGNAVRSTAVTHLNETSSRSHSILILSLQQQLPPSPDSGEVEILSSKLNLIDLAGSERTKKSRVEGSRLKEAVSINQGLLALGNVISALGDVQRRGCHVPYRDSKLTRMLQDSLGGNSFTTLIACVSGSFDNLEETLNTLKYANRARNIQNRAVINKEMLRGADGLSDEQRAMALLKQVVIQLPMSQGCSTTLIQLLEASQYSHKACVLAIQRLKMVILGHDSSELPMDSSIVEQMRTENALLTDTVQDHEATLEQIAMLVTTLGSNVTDAARDAILQRVSVSIPDIIQKIRPPLTSTQHSNSSLTSGLNSHPLSLTTIHEHSDSPYPIPVLFTDALVRPNSKLPNSREPTVTELQAQLSSCASELARTCAELRSAKADLDRDEMIFATKQQEVVSLQLALQESTLEAERLRAEQLEIMQRMSPLVRTSVLMEEGGQVRGEMAAELVDLALSQSHQILQLPQSDGTTTYHSRRYDGANQLESAPAPDGELVLFDEEALSSRCSDTDDDSGSRFESKGGRSEDQSVKAKVSVQALVSAFEHKSRIDRRRAQVEQETAQQARLFKDERVQMEAQILQLEKSIKDQENEITKLLAAEEQARVANHLYKAQVHTLRQEVEEKESEANGLMYQLLELGSNQMRNEEEKARLLIECEKKIDEANKQVNEMKNKLQDK